MKALKVSIRRIGNSLGLILPKEAAQLLNVHEGTELNLTQSQDGIRITPYDPDFDEDMKAAEDIISRYRNTLRALSK